MEIIISSLFIIGFIALIATIIKYPKDVGNSILTILLTPFERAWEYLLLILIPIGLLIIIIEDKFGVNFFSKHINKISGKRTHKTEGRKNINFKKFSKYVLVNTTSDQLEYQLKEAEESCPEVTIEESTIHRSEKYSIIELPNISFYGFNFIIQWFSEFMKNTEVYGFANSGRSQFLTMIDKDNENDLIGLTNTGKTFFVSMYDDLNNKQFLRLNKSIEVETVLTTHSLEQLIKKAI